MRARLLQWRPEWPLLGAALATLVCVEVGTWWTVALPALVVGALAPSATRAALRAAGVGAFVWLGIAMANDALTGMRLSYRIGGVLGSPAPRLAAYLATAAVACALCAAAAWAGFAMRDLVWSTPDARTARQKP